MYGCPHRCSAYSRGKYILHDFTRFTGYLMSSGAPPLANGREAPMARNRSGDAPSSFKQFYAIKNSLQFHKRLRNAKTTWARENPLPTTGAEPCPVREPLRAPRALQTNSTSYYAGEVIQTRKITLQNTINWLNK